MTGRSFHRAPSNAPSLAYEPEATPVALVVDGDGVSRRFVELALGRNAAFVVEEARDAAAAMDILGSQRVDVVIADVDLPDTTGLRLLRRLAQEQRLRGIPFLFLTCDTRSETRIAALRAGADDYLAKPAQAEELRARVENLVGRRQRERDEARRRTYTLAGDFETLSFPDLVALLGMAQRSGVLSVLSPRSTGTVHFDQGTPVHAVFGNLVGVDAFHAIVGESVGHFELAPGHCVLPSGDRTIRETGTALLLEAARISDESSNGASPPPASLVRPPLRGLSARPAPVIAAALPPTTTLAAQLELALRDPFTLGEPRFWSEEQLAKWTSASTGGDRLHAHLVADLAAGVSSILGLAGSPTERWVLDGLTAHRKALGLTFFLRHERTIDIVLLDARDPNVFADCLRRAPAFTIVAPPGGDLMTVGTKGRVALHALLERMTPTALVGVGNGALDAGLRRLEGDTFSRALRCATGSLGDGDCDLRSLLVRGIRLWASTARPSTEAR